MIIRRLLSDQLYNWSDTHEETVVSRIAKLGKSPELVKEVAGYVASLASALKKDSQTRA